MTDHLGDELSALLDGELAPDEEAAVRAHLSQCAVCTAELAAVNHTRSLVRALPMIDPPGLLTLPAEQPAARTPPVGAAAAVAAAVVLFALQWLPSETAVAPSLASLDRTHTSIIQTAGATSPAALGNAARPVVSETPLDGYQRIGTFRRGNVVHVVYSDGTHVLSVFAQPGELAEKELPRGATVLRTKAQTLWHWPRVDGDVVLWESGGAVYTAMGNAPVTQVLTAAASMPDEGGNDSMASRVRRGCRTLADLLTGG